MTQYFNKISTQNGGHGEQQRQSRNNNCGQWKSEAESRGQVQVAGSDCDRCRSTYQRKQPEQEWTQYGISGKKGWHRYYVHVNKQVLFSPYYLTMFSHSLLFLYYTVPLCSNHTVHATVIRLNYEWIQYRAGAEPEWQTNVKETENQDLQNYHQASVAVWSRRIDANKIWSPNCLFLWWSDNMITILPHALNKPIWHVCGNRQICKNINSNPHL